MRVMVTGSREWEDFTMVDTVMSGLLNTELGLQIIEGCASGLDRLVERWAAGINGVSLYHYPASEYKTPLLRNLAMLDTEPELVVAFKDGFGTKLWPSGWPKGGTEHAVRHAEKRGITTWVMQHGF